MPPPHQPRPSRDWFDSLDLGALGFAPAPDPERPAGRPVWRRALPGGAGLLLRRDEEARGAAFLAYVASPRFARVMALWQDADTGPLRAMPRRKLRKDDTLGCLAMAHLDFPDGPPAPDTPLVNGGVSLSLADLARALDALDGPAALNAALMRGVLGRWMAVIEQAWVFLFLAAESGLDAAGIASLGDGWRHGDTALAQWHKTPPITVALAQAYLDRHRAACAPALLSQSPPPRQRG
jgi:hypothetical protein